MGRNRLPVIWVTLFLSAVTLGAAELHVDRTAGNRVRFTARFAGETFVGTTSGIDGYAAWTGDTPDAAGEGSGFYFEVDLNALDTGIGLRNRHMRENYLETEKFPYAAFRGRVTKAVPEGEGEWLVRAEGTFSLHGVDRPLAVTGRVGVGGERFRLSCAFPLTLGDHGIKVPSLAGLKVGEVVEVDLDVTLKRVK